MLEFISCLIVAFLASFGLICLLKDVFLNLCADDAGEIFVLITADSTCNDLDIKIYEAQGRAHMISSATKIFILDSGMSEQMRKIAVKYAENNQVVIIKDIDELKKLI